MNLAFFFFSFFFYFFFPERKKEKKLWTYCLSLVDIKWILYLDNFSTFAGNTPKWVWDMPDLNDTSFTVEGYLQFTILNTLD